MTFTADVPSLVVGVDPTSWAGTIVEGLVTTEGRDAPHATLSSTAELRDFLAGCDPSPPGTHLTILVNVEAFDLADLEAIGAAADAGCLVVALHRRDLDPHREEWALRVGGVALRAGPTAGADIAGLSRLAYGRALRPASATSSPPPPDNMLVFLCYSSGDKKEVRELYRRLTDERIPCWLDEVGLLPGEKWEPTIRNALRRCSHVLVCLTQGATEKRGFVQKELRWAIDEASRQPEGTIFLIPVRLEPCEVPEHLSDWQCVDLFRPDGFARLLVALWARGISTH